MANGREIRKAVFNGLVVWTNDDSEPRLSLEKLSVSATLNQTAGDPTLEVSPTSIDVPQDGSEVQVQVTTNTTFTVS